MNEIIQVPLRRGVITFDHLMQPGDEIQKDLKRWLMLYDSFLVPNLAERIESWRQLLAEQPDEAYDQIFSDLEWLASGKLLLESPVNFDTEAGDKDRLVAELRQLHETSWAGVNKVYETAEEAATGTVANLFNIEIATSRLITHVLWRDKQESVFPVVFPFEKKIEGFELIGQRQQVLSIVLDQIPEPSENLPLQVIVDFKKDEVTKTKYNNLWRWIAKIAKTEQPAYELKEEIQFLINDYATNLKRLTKQTSLSRIQTIVNSSGDAVKNLLTFQWGKILGVTTELKQISMNASNEELKLPGSELAYIKEAAEFLAGQQGSR